MLLADSAAVGNILIGILGVVILGYFVWSIFFDDGSDRPFYDG